MKRFITFFAVVAAVLIAASCTKSEEYNADAACETVSYTVSLSDAVQTRAFGEGTEVDKVFCGVYEKKGEGVYEYLEGSSTEIALDSEKKAKFEPSLFSGRTYKIVFFAQCYGINNETPVYSVDKDNAIVSFPVNTSLFANTESLDAFAFVDEIKVGTDAPEAAVLKRPFAQINIGCTATDFANATKLGETPAKSKVVLTGCYKSFDLLNNEPEGEVSELTYLTSALPEGTFKVAENEYNYLAMVYAIPGATINCTIDIRTDSKSINEVTIENVPAVANTRTNIYGNLMTGTVTYYVELSGFTGEDKTQQVPAE
ncbi:MAG: hypothetical protein J6A22_03565 [Bacteroidales bacterium]|nr:hypothetical protein [Bacteroidales bacterium]